MGILLYLIATLLWIVLTPLNWIIVTFKHGFSNKYFLETAVDLDKFGNRNFRTFLNATMIKDKIKHWDSERYMIIESYKFGDVRETISSALGKNQRDKTLTLFGKLVCNILNFLDKNHCEKSIKEL